MSSNPANQPIEDQFLRWRQEIEAKQEEQAKQMAELRDHSNSLQQENERLQTSLETNRGENSRGSVHLAPPTQPNKGKEPILMGESDPPTDDELSSGSSPLLDCSPPQNNVEAESKKAPTPIQPIHQWRASPGMKRGQQRQIPFRTSPRICACPARGMAP